MSGRAIYFTVVLVACALMGACDAFGKGPVVPARGGGGSGATSISGLSDYLNVSTQVNVKSFGAVGDGIMLTNATMTSGAARFGSVSGAFAAGDVGKMVLFPKAAAGGDFTSAVVSVQSATQMTLAANATADWGPTNAWYGTLDTAAFQDAINAVSNISAALVLPDGLYLVGPAATDRGDGQLSALTVPMGKGGWYGQPRTLAFRGQSRQGTILGPVASGDQKQRPPNSGAVIVWVDNASDGHLFSSYATGTYQNFTPVHVMFEDVAFVTPNNAATRAVLDLRYSLGATLRRVLFTKTTFPLDSVGPVESRNYNQAYFMPQLGNNANSIAEDVFVSGYYRGATVGEHFNGNRLLFYAAKEALTFDQCSHPGYIGHMQAEKCARVVLSTNGLSRFGIERLGVERDTTGTSTNWTRSVLEVQDTNGLLRGNIGYTLARSGIGAEPGSNLLISPTAVNVSTREFGNYQEDLPAQKVSVYKCASNYNNLVVSLNTNYSTATFHIKVRSTKSGTSDTLVWEYNGIVAAGVYDYVGLYVNGNTAPAFGGPGVGATNAVGGGIPGNTSPDGSFGCTILNIAGLNSPVTQKPWMFTSYSPYDNAAANANQYFSGEGGQVKTNVVATSITFHASAGLLATNSEIIVIQSGRSP